MEQNKKSLKDKMKKALSYMPIIGTSLGIGLATAVSMGVVPGMMVAAGIGLGMSTGVFKRTNIRSDIKAKITNYLKQKGLEIATITTFIHEIDISQIHAEIESLKSKEIIKRFSEILIRIQKSNMDDDIKLDLVQMCASYLIDDIKKVPLASRSYFEVFTKICFLISRGENIVDLEKLNHELGWEETIFEKILKNEALEYNEYNDLYKIIERYKFRNPELANEILNSLDNFQEISRTYKPNHPNMEPHTKFIQDIIYNKYLTHQQLELKLRQKLDIDENIEINDEIIFDKLREKFGLKKYIDDKQVMAYVRFNLKYSDGSVKSGFYFAYNIRQIMEGTHYDLTLGKYVLDENNEFNI